MVKNDEGIVSLKHRVMQEVARLAWDDELTPENEEKLVYEISPGPRPEYRCCVYKEREIVRQRIRLAKAECPSPDRELKPKLPAPERHSSSRLITEASWRT